MDLHPDFSDLLAEFGRFAVRYALLGGYAVGYYSKARATKDLDLLISGVDGNLDRVASALAAFGAPAAIVEAARTMGPSEIVYLGQPPLRIDLLRSADGIDTEAALGRAPVIELSHLQVPVLALDDLIENKRAAGRPQDRADVAALERVRTRSEA